MKCPLRDIARYSREGWGHFEKADCLKEECAWWHMGLEECSIYLMQEHLAILFGTLIHIEDKMPHVEQFKR